MEKNLTRPPVVVVLGHVDHGKTTLLDAIRKTSIAKREAGGITQSIGATVVDNSDAKITFIDTPGHALFSSMRLRGVNLADIAILVVAGDDGVQPQTKEALKLIQESKLPFVVAITKIDLATANSENVLQQLEKEGVYFEKRGGDIPYLGVSAKSGEGIKELLDLISLIWEVNGTGTTPNEELSGFVIETSKDKRGLLVSVVVKSGILKVGDTVYARELSAKIKGMIDDTGKQVKEIMPGYPAQIIGFSELPETGSQIAKQFVNTQTNSKKEKSQDGEAKVKIFVKAKTAGSLEALLANIPEGVQALGSGVGDVNESDIFFAKASGAIIFLFEAKIPNTVRKLAETEGIRIENFDIIYGLIERLTLLSKEGLEQVVGKAQIVASFPYENKRVAGSKIIQGKITKGDSAKLIRNEKEIGKVRITSIRKQKDEVNEVKQGEECGILFSPQFDFLAGDMLLSVTKSNNNG